jgi:hypothetical protein
MEHLCKTCDLFKTRDLFPKATSHTHKCNSCIAEVHRRKIPCEICKKIISYGNMNKHMFVHDHNSPPTKEIICDCGKVIKERSLPSHKKSKKHIFEMDILKTENEKASYLDTTINGGKTTE